MNGLVVCNFDYLVFSCNRCDIAEPRRWEDVTLQITAALNILTPASANSISQIHFDAADSTKTLWS